MSIGALVSVPELQSEGLARLMSLRGGYSVIRFLLSGAEKTQESKAITRFALLPGTRILATVADDGSPDAEVSGTISARKLQRDAASGLLVYGVRDSAGRELVVREDAITGVPVAIDPLEQLLTAQFNDLRPVFAKAGTALPPEPWAAQTCAAREELLAWRDDAWRLTGGVVGLSAARVEALPHQWLVARQALGDAKVRFLLADEVGLGKTIEAGLIIQSLLAMKPGLRVLVIAPGALLSQWFLELHVRFGGLPFVMLDQERLETWEGNPWSSGQFVLASSRAVEELEGKAAIAFAAAKWDVVVVDECHRMRPGGILSKRVAILSKSAPHVLLLSATPARQHPDAWLALLALLQPTVWKVDDIAAFSSRLQVHEQVVELLSRTLAADSGNLAPLAADWLALVPGDRILAQRAEAMAAHPEAKPALITYVREHLQFDRRVIRNRRQVLARLAAAGGMRAVAPTTRSHEVVTYHPDAPEQAVRQALTVYRTTLAATASPVPPRLAHWLLQVELALAAHPQVLERLLAMRATVLEAPEDFNDYRVKARAGETLAQVLRSDLSENEINSHVAISAACHADPEREQAAIAGLRAAVATWKARKSTARLQALITRLERFWEESPQEKVLIFTTHALAVEPLATVLGKAFGEHAVATFGAHQDTLDREESARRFRSDRRCPILVCDPLGGEGRNFQFVSIVVHHDLPWSLAAVEQRIGRVDRLGRDGDIPSWVLAPSDPLAIDAAWGELLHTAVGVFTASSSGMEFIADALEGLALAGALSDGGPGVRAIMPEAVAIVERERSARDRREEDCFQTDAVTYAAASAASAAVAQAAAPASAVARWIRGLGGEVRRDDEYPRSWKLRTRYHEEPQEGVFERAVALSHPHLAFYGIGHHLIDRLVDDAASAIWCQACAWRRPKPSELIAWNGVRAVYVLAPDLGAIAGAGLRLEVLRRLFLVAPPVRILVAAHADTGTIAEDAALVAALTPPFSAKAGDAALSAAVNRDVWARPLLNGQPEKVIGWQDGVRRGAAAAAKRVEAMLPSRLSAQRAALDALLLPALDALDAAAAVAEARHGADHPEARRARGDAAEERQQAAALRAAVDGAKWTLETIAFVALA